MVEARKMDKLGLAKDKNEAVKVAIRCRPLNNKELQAGNTQVVEINKARNEILVHKPFGQEEPKQFTFDHTYGDGAQQEEIYNETASPIVANVLEGYNGTIFAYGQTGTGKTHTMTGIPDDKKERGIMTRAFDDIFQSIQSDSDQT